MLALMAALGLSMADTPDLTGNWTGSYNGYTNGIGYTDGNFTMVISEQKDRIFTGTFIINSSSAQVQGSSEVDFSGAIDFDNRTFYTVSSKGQSRGTLISEDTLELIYLKGTEPTGTSIDIAHRVK